MDARTVSCEALGRSGIKPGNDDKVGRRKGRGLYFEVMRQTPSQLLGGSAFRRAQRSM
jgi:hypothetical protein